MYIYQVIDRYAFISVFMLVCIFKYSLEPRTILTNRPIVYSTNYNLIDREYEGIYTFSIQHRRRHGVNKHILLVFSPAIERCLHSCVSVWVVHIVADPYSQHGMSFGADTYPRTRGTLCKWVRWLGLDPSYEPAWSYADQEHSLCGKLYCIRREICIIVYDIIKY